MADDGKIVIYNSQDGTSQRVRADLANQLIESSNGQLHDPSADLEHDTIADQNARVTQANQRMHPGPPEATQSQPDGPPVPPKTLQDQLDEYEKNIRGKVGGGGGGYGAAGLLDEQQQANANEYGAAQATGKANVEAAALPRQMAEQQPAQIQAAQQSGQQQLAALQQMIADRTAQQEKLMDEDRKLTINPDHWWTSRNAGQKISAGLGVALGALGSAFTKGPNFAMDIINKAIDQDFEAQKENIINQRGNTEARGNFLQRAIQNGFSIAEAKNMLAQRGLENVQSTIGMLRNTQSSDQAKAAADALTAEVAKQQVNTKFQRDQQISQLASSAASTAHMGFENMDLVSQMALRRYMMEHPEQFPKPGQVTFVNGQQVQVPQGANAEKLGDQLGAYGGLIHELDDAMDPKKTGSSWGIPGFESTAEGHAASDRIKVALEKASPGLSPRLMEQIRDQVPGNAYGKLFHAADLVKTIRDEAIEGARQTLLRNGSTPEVAKRQVEIMYPMPEWKSE